MKITLATGIFPPAIGGPATYVESLAKEFIRREQEVTVITYANGVSGGISVSDEGGKTVVRVAKWGGPLLRWLRYKKALQRYAEATDVVLAFSSVSVGIPLRMAKLKKPHRFLRLGGDYFWERYTAIGGMRTLKEWYQLRSPRYKRTVVDDAAYMLTRRLNTWVLKPLLPAFHHVVFSTQFQEDIYRLYYARLPQHSVIENAFPDAAVITTSPHIEKMDELKTRHFRLLYFGRFVGFKNLTSLVKAVSLLPHAKLALVGDGPQGKNLRALVQKLGIIDRVSFTSPKNSSEKKALFADYDLMVLPSLTEISPNSALEARSAALPVLLTDETGLSEELTRGMVLRPLREAADIMRAVLDIEQHYGEVAADAVQPLFGRSWEQVAAEWIELFGKHMNTVAVS
ncbi:MAG: glucosyltransferase [Candidatus Peribacteria bacterium]|nr:glucosyltransferase [Candidatus Peribacteria bacterium]